MKRKTLFVPLLLGLSAMGPDAFAQDPVFSLAHAPSIKLGKNQTITQGNTAIDVSQLGAISGLSVSGTGALTSEKGYVRIILVSAAGEEYLVFETNALLSQDKKIKLVDYCEETQQLDDVLPRHLKFEIAEGSFKLTAISASAEGAASSLKNLPADSRKAARDAQMADKLLKIRYAIKQKGLHWVAGETPVSRMSYSEKRQYFGGKVPHFYGFEYYLGGVFEIPSSSVQQTATQSLATSPYINGFSWRNKHGQNWMTPVKNQGGCGSCWAFCATGATELLTNLYFNRHLDLDLSEQQALSCMGGGSCMGGVPGTVLDYTAANGIMDEGCFPYTATDQACTNACTNSTELVRIGGRNPFFNDSEDTLKGMILRSAVSAGIVNWWHCLTLVGYQTLKAGDSYFIRTSDGNTQWITIAPNDPLIGSTVWEFKNSWGPLWGDNGYCYVVTTLSNIYLTDELLGPVIRRGHTNSEILCTDADQDGYYAWGVGSKPAHCPASQVQPDGDDSDPCKGPMDPYGNTTPLCATVQADFVADNLAPCISKPVVFTDRSTGPVVSWNWNFGSGANPSTGTGKGPFTVTYATSGLKTVTLTVSAGNGATNQATKTNYISVPAICNPVKLEVYARNEAYNETNIMKPRIYIANMGNVAISDFKMVFKFTSNGKTPVLEDYYTPYETVRLMNAGSKVYKVEYNFSGYTLAPGGIVPNTSGNVIGLHYSDWSKWVVTTSFKPGASFSLNGNLGIYDKNGTLVYGQAQ